MAKNKKVVSGKQPGRRVVKTKDGTKLVIKVRSSNLGVRRKPVTKPRHRHYKSGKRMGDKR